ncbi:MAG: outer membrane beta-barrel protein [Opitutales bacterium]
MKRYYIMLPILFGCSAVATSASVSQGMREIGFSGSYQNNNIDFNIGSDTDFEFDGDGDTLSLTGSFGYFFTDNWQGTINATYQQMDFGDGGTDTFYLGGGVDYHFMPQSELVPYAGIGGAYGSVDLGDLGGEIGSISDEDFVVQLRLGLKQFITDNIAVRYQIDWNQGENTESLGASFGLSTFF